MDILIKAVQLILSLSILVVLHEFGHYLTARYFKIRVEKFYLFFNPWFSLFKKKIGDTEWGIGWLPLGGYVKISGMIDESMDKEQMAKPAEDWEFRSKPAWQRLIVMIGGVVVNLIVGVFIYMMVVFAWGEEQILTKNLEHGLNVHSALAKYNVHNGDNILSINGKEITHINDINNGILLRDQKELTVQHKDGSIENITLPEGIDYELFEAGAFPAVTLQGYAVIHSVDSAAIAEQIGFKAGDQIKSIGNEDVYFGDIRGAFDSNAGKTIDITVLRDNKEITLSTPVGADSTIGMVYNIAGWIEADKIETVKYGFGASIGRGFNKGMTTLGDYVGQLKFLFTKKGASSLGGFGAIGNLFPAKWDWEKFWLNTALISIILAFMNILPIPALDGGHVVFLLYEIITGKEAPEKVLEYAQYAGFFILMALLLYANGNDIYRAILGG
ncbi:MAG: RIP metalloprotease RseP [Crocinitomicaceae bacterium]|nr:RIP metalloprotease RseP [Crocinitomicaceae bacterium]